VSSLVRLAIRVFALLSLCTALSPSLHSQERPYFVAYDHYLEEPGNLEIEYFSTFGTQRGGNNFHSFWTEFEYGVTAWWTTELYLDGQTTFHDSTVFTGFRWENRFRPLKHEHFINPILYVEFENKNGADKILKEGEGHDVEADFLTPNAEARQEHIREVELKLILSSTFKGWNFAQNTRAAKNLANSPGNSATPSVPAALWPSRPPPRPATSAARILSPASRCMAASATATILACTKLRITLPLSSPGIFPQTGPCASLPVSDSTTTATASFSVGESPAKSPALAG